MTEDEDGARLRRVEHDVRSVRGLIATPPGLESQDFDELIEEAMADHATEMLRGCRMPAKEVIRRDEQGT